MHPLHSSTQQAVQFLQQIKCRVNKRGYIFIIGDLKDKSTNHIWAFIGILNQTNYKRKKESEKLNTGWIFSNSKDLLLIFNVIMILKLYFERILIF